MAFEYSLASRALLASSSCLAAFFKNSTATAVRSIGGNPAGTLSANNAGGSSGPALAVALAAVADTAAPGALAEAAALDSGPTVLTASRSSSLHAKSTPAKAIVISVDWFAMFPLEPKKLADGLRVRKPFQGRSIF